MNNMILMAARILLIVGIIVICGSTLLANYNEVLLVTNKAKLEDFERMKNEKYSVKKPEKPIDMSEYIVHPKKINKESSESEKEQYKQELDKYNSEVKNAEEVYKKKIEEYETGLAKYDYDLKNTKYNKLKDEGELNKSKNELIKKIQRSENAKDFKVLPFIIRYIGAFILLIGTLGILMFAEVQEKLGVLILIGFGFKWIIGE